MSKNNEKHIVIGHRNMTLKQSSIARVREKFSDWKPKDSDKEWVQSVVDNLKKPCTLWSYEPVTYLLLRDAKKLVLVGYKSERNIWKEHHRRNVKVFTSVGWTVEKYNNRRHGRILKSIRALSIGEEE